MKDGSKQAIALHYDGKKAPIVTAKGEGKLAEQLIALARMHQIPIKQDKQLTALLSKVQLHEEIPPSLYVAVAQMLTLLYFLNGKTPEDYHD